VRGMVGVKIEDGKRKRRFKSFRNVGAEIFVAGTPYLRLDEPYRFF
jgi:hypothetical protein